MKTINLILIISISLMNYNLMNAQIYNGTSPVQTTTPATNSSFVGVGTNEPITDFQIGEKWTFQDDPAKRLMGSNSYWDMNQYQFTRIKKGAASTMAMHDDGISFYVAENGTGGTKITYNSLLNIHNEGYVMIGLTSISQPQTNQNGIPYPLYVRGGIMTEELKVEVASGNWADYVFDENYALKSLEKVEKYIAETGHLHNTKSAKEIEENGLELKSVTINQQEKIEELYLHMIELNKEIKKLKAQVQELSK